MIFFNYEFFNKNKSRKSFKVASFLDASNVDFFIKIYKYEPFIFIYSSYEK